VYTSSHQAAPPMEFDSGDEEDSWNVRSVVIDALTLPAYLIDPRDNIIYAAGLAALSTFGGLEKPFESIPDTKTQSKENSSKGDSSKNDRSLPAPCVVSVATAVGDKSGNAAAGGGVVAMSAGVVPGNAVSLQQPPETAAKADAAVGVAVGSLSSALAREDLRPDAATKRAREEPREGLEKAVALIDDLRRLRVFDKKGRHINMTRKERKMCMSVPFLQPMDISRVGKEEYLRVTNGPMDLRVISDALGLEKKKKSRKRARYSRAAEDDMRCRKMYQSFSEVVHDLRTMFGGALRHIESHRFPLVRRRMQAMSHYVESVAGAVEGTALWAASLF